ncbi:MAG: hypothetical protein ACKO2P_12965 [Planctomycetota bacterium]
MPQPDSQPRVRHLLPRGCAIAGLCAVCLVVLPDWLPLGVPGEWTWPRLAAPVDIPEWVERSLPCLISGLLLVAVAVAGDRPLARRNRWQRLLFSLLLAGSAAIWQAGAVSATPSPQRELRWLWVNYDPWATGYFFDAVADRRSLSEFLRGYEAETAAGDVLHRGTHPPGLPVLNRLLLRITRGSPVLSATVISLADGPALQTFRSLEGQAALASPLTDPDLAALVLCSAVALGCCGCLPVLVFLLLEPVVGHRGAWRSAVLSAAIPAVAVFLPRSDMHYAASGCLLLLLVGRGMSATARVPRLLLSVVGGVWLFGCLQVSLAHLPVLAAAGIWTFLGALRRPYGAGRDVVWFWGILLAAFLTAAVLFSVSTGCRPWVVWRQNLINHEAFYSEYSRTWWKWLLVNPLELFFASGPPLALAGIAGASAAVRQLFSRSPMEPQKTLAAAVFLVWLLLLLSGKNQGEAARLWTFLTPWVSVCAAARLEPAGSVKGAGTDQAPWLLLLVAQLLCCAVTAGRVSGYLQL